MMLNELRRAYDLQESAEASELGGDVEAALAGQRAALEMAPHNPEIAFWTAVSLAGLGLMDEARETIEIAFRADAGWPELLRRLAGAGEMRLSPEAVRQLLG